MAAIGFEVLLGSITVTERSSPLGKLQEWITSKPVTFKGQNVVNGLLFLGILSLLVYVVVDPATRSAFFAMIGAAVVFGVLLVMPIGGADMPVVVALLNSYCGPRRRARRASRSATSF